MIEARPFEEYKEMIKDMRKEEMIKGLYDLSKNVIEKDDEIERLKEQLNDEIQEELEQSEIMVKKQQEIERLNKALLDIKELVVNNACLSEEDNQCVDDLIYYKCDELLGIVNKALGSDKE